MIVAGPYKDTTIEQIYRHCIRNYKTAAEAWIAAENIFELRTIICEWFISLEDGTAQSRFPNPLGISVTEDKAQKMVATLDDDFDREQYRWKDCNLTAGPGFSRLRGAALIAFVQEILSTVKSDDQIMQEALQRQENGEILPPPEIKQGWPMHV